MQATAQETFGQNIDDLVSIFYKLEPDDRDIFLRNFPQVEQYLDWKARYVIQSPLLSAYYNGQSKIRDYYEGQFKRAVEDKLGADIWDVIQEGYRVRDTISEEAYRSYLIAHPQIKSYYTLKDDYAGLIDRKVLEFAKYIPEALPSPLRPGEPQSIGAQDLQAGINTPSPTWQEVSAGLAQDLQAALGDYYTTGRPMSYTTRTRLERIAKYQWDLSLNELLDIAGKELVQ